MPHIGQIAYANVLGDMTTYSVDVLPTRFGRWGFYLYEQGKPEQVWQYMEASVVIARIEEEKQRLHERRGRIPTRERRGYPAATFMNNR